MRVRRTLWAAALSLLSLIAAVGVAVAAVAVAAAGTGTYKGSTSQSEPVTIVIAHKVVDGAAQNVVEKAPSTIQSAAACVGGGSLTSTTHLEGVMQGSDFSVKNEHYHDMLKGGGEVFHTVTVRFSVTGRVLTGTFIDRAAIRRDGRVVHRCTTGKLTFRATRGTSGAVQPGS